MKHLRSEKGSTLLLVVITIAVLAVLGSTLLSMSYMNINMKFTDERMKKDVVLQRVWSRPGLCDRGRIYR